MKVANSSERKNSKSLESLGHRPNPKPKDGKIKKNSFETSLSLSKSNFLPIPRHALKILQYFHASSSSSSKLRLIQFRKIPSLPCEEIPQSNFFPPRIDG